MNKSLILDLAAKELRNISVHASVEQQMDVVVAVLDDIIKPKCDESFISSVSPHAINGRNINRCIYGLMTGDCTNFKARQLLYRCAMSISFGSIDGRDFQARPPLTYTTVNYSCRLRYSALEVSLILYRKETLSMILSVLFWRDHENWTFRDEVL